MSGILHIRFVLTVSLQDSISEREVVKEYQFLGHIAAGADNRLAIKDTIHIS